MVMHFQLMSDWGFNNQIIMIWFFSPQSDISWRCKTINNSSIAACLFEDVFSALTLWLSSWKGIQSESLAVDCGDLWMFFEVYRHMGCELSCANVQVKQKQTNWLWFNLQHGLELMSIIAVMVNCALIGMSDLADRLFPGWGMAGRIVFIVALEVTGSFMLTTK